MSQIATSDAAEEPEPLWAPERVSALLDVPLGTLGQWRATGREPGLPFLKIGGLVRYRPADVRRYIESRVRQPGAARTKQTQGAL